ncbi:MAG: response regulator [Candidatus Nanoarchaeia archaeon]|nr:response regulator [Candidatus Nanoarchaeia archaeon]
MEDYYENFKSETMEEKNNSKKRILVVDDEVNITRLVKISLESNDIEVIESAGGQESIMLAVKNKPSLIILDLMMPRHSGYDILDMLKTHEETIDIPVLILTAKDTQIDREKCLKSGAEGFISKPFDLDDLRKTVKSFLI